jgi:hypothetical protein
VHEAVVEALAAARGEEWGVIPGGLTSWVLSESGLPLALVVVWRCFKALPVTMRVRTRTYLMR